MKKYENFCSALCNMKEIYKYDPPYDTVILTGMIKDEELWLRALQERNNVAHSYNERIALGIVMQAKESFYDMFCQLKNEIDKNWL